MVKTGSEIFTVLTILATLAPLFPVLILFIRHIPPNPTLNLLRVVCIAVFVQNVLFSIPGLNPLYKPFISAAFRLGEFSLLYILFVQATLPKRFQEVMKMLLISLLSVIVTVYYFRGADAFPATITALESALLVCLAFTCLARLIGNRGIILFQETLFWIAGGVICYFGTYLFIEIITHTKLGLSQDINEKLTVFSLAGISRFLFFSIAAIVAPVRREP